MTVHPKNPPVPLPLPLLPLPLPLPPGKRPPTPKQINYANILILPMTRPLPAPIAAPPKARSKIELPVLKNKGLDNRWRGEERRMVRIKRVRRFIIKALALV